MRLVGGGADAAPVVQRLPEVPAIHPERRADLSRLLSAMREVIPQAKAFQRHLARNAELSGREYKAQAAAVALLRELGVEHEKVGLNTIGWFGDVWNKPAILLRAEMDALPYPGPDGKTIALQTCGHDATGGALVAQTMAYKRLLDAGHPPPHPLVVVFQSSEEDPLTSGAKEVVESSVFNLMNIRAGGGPHLAPDRRWGLVSADPGLVNAASTRISLDFTGKEGHGGYVRHPADVRMLGEMALADPSLRLIEKAGRPIQPNEAAIDFWTELNGKRGRSSATTSWPMSAGGPPARVVART